MINPIPMTYRDGKTAPAIGDATKFHHGGTWHVAKVEALSPDTRQVQITVEGWLGRHYYPATDCELLPKAEGEKKPAAPSVRTIAAIAREIRKDWQKDNYGARPYLDAMFSLNTLKDNYGEDSGYSVVAYFLSNATTWRGDVARRVKAELNAMLKAHNKARG